MNIVSSIPAFNVKDSPARQPASVSNDSAVGQRRAPVIIEQDVTEPVLTADFVEAAASIERVTFSQTSDNSGPLPQQRAIANYQQTAQISEGGFSLLDIVV